MLQEALGTAQLRRLGTAWETMRRSAPTHPHPVIPRRPPGNAVVGVPLSLYDRIRDMLGLRLSAAALKKILTGLLGLAVCGVAAAILRKRH